MCEVLRAHHGRELVDLGTSLLEERRLRFVDLLEHAMLELVDLQVHLIHLLDLEQYRAHVLLLLGAIAVAASAALVVVVEAVDARQLVGLMAAGRLGIVRRLVDVDESARMIEVRHGHFAKRVLELHFKS